MQACRASVSFRRFAPATTDREQRNRTETRCRAPAGTTMERRRTTRLPNPKPPRSQGRGPAIITSRPQSEPPEPFFWDWMECLVVRLEVLLSGHDCTRLGTTRTWHVSPRFLTQKPHAILSMYQSRCQATVIPLQRKPSKRSFVV
jgi:hypothetical protein